MAVRIRLSRFGRLHRPFFRIVAIDQRCHREGLANEILGTYDPLAAANNITVDVEKVQAWLGRGALISESLGNLLKHHGVALPARPAPKRVARVKAAVKPKADGKRFVPASRRAVRQHAAKLKAERKAKAAADAATAKPAEAATAAEAPKA